MEFRVGDSQNPGQPDCTAGGREVGDCYTLPTDRSVIACCYAGEEAMPCRRAQGAERHLSSSQQLTCVCSQTELPAPSASSSLASPCAHVRAAAGKMASVHSPRKKRLCWGPPGVPLSIGVRAVRKQKKSLSSVFSSSLTEGNQRATEITWGQQCAKRELPSPICPLLQGQACSEAGCTGLSPDSSH